MSQHHTYLIHTAIENGEARVIYRLTESEDDTVVLDCRTKPGQIARLRYGTIEVTDAEPFAFKLVDIEPTGTSGASTKFDMASRPYGFYAVTIAEAPAETLDPCILFSWQPEHNAIRMASFSAEALPQYVRDLRTDDELTAMEVEFANRKKVVLAEQIGMLEGKIAALSSQVSELDQAQGVKTQELASLAEQLEALQGQLSKLTGPTG